MNLIDLKNIIDKALAEGWDPYTAVLALDANNEVVEFTDFRAAEMDEVAYINKNDAGGECIESCFLAITG